MNSHRSAFGLVDVTIGALLGVVLARASIFEISRFEDLVEAASMIGLLILFSINCHFTQATILQNRLGYSLGSIGLFLLAELILFVHYLVDFSPDTTKNIDVRFIFVGASHIWLVLIFMLIWYVIYIVLAFRQRS